MFRIRLVTAIVLIVALFLGSTAIVYLTVLEPGIFYTVITLIGVAGVLLATYMGICLFECQMAMRHNSREIEVELHEEHYHRSRK